MIQNRSLARRGAAVVAAGAAALVLAACGGDGDSDSSAGHGGHKATASASASSSASASASQGQRNAADVAFAQGMIPITARPSRWPASRPAGRSRPR